MNRPNRFSSLFLLSSLVLLCTVYLVSCAPSEPTRTKNAQKTCLDCHSEYAERFSTGVVHQPVLENKCNTCHRKHGQIGGVYMRQPEPDLCYRCHRDVSTEIQSVQYLHQPVVDSGCSVCHLPHNGENPSLLQKAQKDLCFTCHSDSAFKGANVHQPVAEGCNSCHPAHGSDVDGLLRLPLERLCSDCHSADDQTFGDKHGGLAVEGACLECHTVHTSDNKALLKSRVHVPVAELDCASCHASSQAGDIILSADAVDLCLTCHDGVTVMGENVHSPVTTGDCLECHSPHASDYSGILTASPDSLCFSCHEFDFLGPEPKIPGQGSAHTIVKDGDCQSCHFPHESTAGQPALLRAPAETLCQECHEDVFAPKSVEHAPVKEGECFKCHESHESETAGVLVAPQQKLCADCHESVTEDMGKLSLHKPFSKGQCSSCHNPHGAEEESLLIGTGAGSCDSCHLQLADERALDARHAPFVDGECATCHDPHSSDEKALLSAPIAGVCFNCHDDKQPVAGYQKKHENCASCHAPHGNEGDSYLIQSAPKLCMNCHSIDEYWVKGVGHQPAVDGDCVSCHDPHFADESKIVKSSWDKQLCAQCHDVDASTLKASHQDIIPTDESCRSCHDPHGGADKSLTHPVKHDPFSQGECIVCHTGA